MARFDEAKHPRDEDGKWTEADSEDLASTIGNLAGSLVGYSIGDNFATKAFNAAAARWGVTEAAAASRFLAPALRFGASFVLGGAAATGIGLGVAAAAVGGVQAYHGIRSWLDARQHAQKIDAMAALMKRST